MVKGLCRRRIVSAACTYRVFWYFGVLMYAIVSRRKELQQNNEVRKNAFLLDVFFGGGMLS